jgi:putative chitinase
MPVTRDSAPTRSKLTPEMISNEFKFKSSDAESNLRLILDTAPEFGVSRKEEMDIYLALVIPNSGFFTLGVENLNYSAQRLVAVWPQFFDTQTAQDYAGKPEAIANKIYGGRFGNNQEGDGFKFRGPGYMWMTGRGVYREVGNVLKVPLEDSPQTLLEPEVNARASAYLFNKYTEVARKTGTLDIATANIAINGGLVGLDETQAIYERLRKLTN